MPKITRPGQIGAPGTGHCKDAYIQYYIGTRLAPSDGPQLEKRIEGFQISLIAKLQGEARNRSLLSDPPRTPRNRTSDTMSESDIDLRQSREIRSSRGKRLGSTSGAERARGVQRHDHQAHECCTVDQYCVAGI